MGKKIFTIVLCGSLIAFFMPFVVSSPVSAEMGMKCQCRGDGPCQCGPACTCEHCKTAKGCQCGPNCQCEHCRTGKGHCECRPECKGCQHQGKHCQMKDKGCQCGPNCQCEHCKTGKGHCQCAPAKDAKAAAPGVTSLPTVAGLFTVAYVTEPKQPPLNAFHSWTLSIKAADGKPVTDAEIAVSGGMPAHGHGLQSEPRVTKNLGNGHYLVEGIKFFMPGQWVMNFTIKSGGKEDNVTFAVDI